MLSSHVSAYLVASLTTTFAYGEFHTHLLRHLLHVMSGIVVTLFLKSVDSILRKRTSGKFNIPLAIASVLIFVFATLVSQVDNQAVWKPNPFGDAVVFRMLLVCGSTHIGPL